MQWVSFQIFNLGNFSLQNGGRIPDAYLAYKTYGTLSDAKDNVIVYPTWYSGMSSVSIPFV